MPTPSAPPKTESTVRSMPALDKPTRTPRIKKPTRHKRARTTREFISISRMFMMAASHKPEMREAMPKAKNSVRKPTMRAQTVSLSVPIGS